MSAWIEAVAADDDLIGIDLRVASVLAEAPERVWSTSEVIRRFWGELDPASVADAVMSLAELHIEELVYVPCSDAVEHRDGFWGDECTDPLCGDSLFRVNVA
ncbi:hypothetical protein [Mycolicibacterium sp. PDY-3]|uniref:hypothetical protein n=1 Tax=Mycolicibacterium sp. PDY-3 TaxID=3376069 RepID=UPI0037B046E6